MHSGSNNEHRRSPTLRQRTVVANAVAFPKVWRTIPSAGGASEFPEGKLRSRHVIIEFKDYQQLANATRDKQLAKMIKQHAKIRGDMRYGS